MLVIEDNPLNMRMFRALIDTRTATTSWKPRMGSLVLLSLRSIAPN